MAPLEHDLESTFGELAATLPRRTTEDVEVDFSRDNLPRPPAALSTRAFWFRRPYLHTYNNFPVPGIDMCIDKPGCRLLGLLILAVVLHPEPEMVEVALQHHPAQINLLRIRHEQKSWLADYKTIPESFSYGPAPVERHPWDHFGINRADLPMIEITDRSELGPTDMAKWHSATDTIVGFGHDRSAVQMAELLLNASLEDSDEVEFDLESGVGGYPSVTLGSAELQIWLPGGLGYIDSDD